MPAVVGKFEQTRSQTWQRNWMTSPQDRAALIYLLRSIKAETVLEIGINYGWTARCLLENVETIKRYIGVDVFPNYRPTDLKQIANIPTLPGDAALKDDRLQLMIYPRGSLEINEAMLPTLDVAFIDGDHGYEVVAHDTKLAMEKVRNGGLLIWHDYHEGSREGVRKYLEDIFPFRPTIRHIRTTWLAYEEMNGRASH